MKKYFKNQDKIIVSRIIVKQERLLFNVIFYNFIDQLTKYKIIPIFLLFFKTQNVHIFLT